MRVTVIAKPNASHNQVIQIDDATYRVFTTATPENGKANLAIARLLADFLDVPVSTLKIVFGKTAKEKIIEVAID